MIKVIVEKNKRTNNFPRLGEIGERSLVGYKIRNDKEGEELQCFRGIDVISCIYNRYFSEDNNSLQVNFSEEIIEEPRKSWLGRKKIREVPYPSLSFKIPHKTWRVGFLEKYFRPDCEEGVWKLKRKYLGKYVIVESLGKKIKEFLVCLNSLPVSFPEINFWGEKIFTGSYYKNGKWKYNLEEWEKLELGI